MVVVMAKLSVKPDKKAELLALARDVIAATRKEPGCISYSLMEDPYDAGTCLFVEEWTDKKALEAHLTMAHLAEWRAKSKDLLAGKTAIKLYQAEETSL